MRHAVAQAGLGRFRQVGQLRCHLRGIPCFVTFQVHVSLMRAPNTRRQKKASHKESQPQAATQLRCEIQKHTSWGNHHATFLANLPHDVIYQTCRQCLATSQQLCFTLSYSSTNSTQHLRAKRQGTICGCYEYHNMISLSPRHILPSCIWQPTILLPGTNDRDQADSRHRRQAPSHTTTFFTMYHNEHITGKLEAEMHPIVETHSKTVVCNPQQPRKINLIRSWAAAPASLPGVLDPERQHAYERRSFLARQCSEL